MPSRLPEIYWAYTFQDLRSRLRLKVNLENLRGLMEFDNLVEVAAAVFGGKGKGKGKGAPDGAKPAQSVAEAQAQFAAVMREARGG